MSKIKTGLIYLLCLLALQLSVFTASAQVSDTPRNFMETIYSQPEVAASFTPGCLGKAYPAYTDRQGWADLLGEDLTKQLIATGERFLDYSWQYIPASAYLEFNKSGNRTVMEGPHGQNRAALAALLFAELAEGKGRFVPKIGDGLYYFAFMPAWIIAAHIWRQPTGSSLPSGDYHFIDLFDGEVGGLVSWCLYFMEDEVDKLDPFICRAARRALDKNIIEPYLDFNKEVPQWWMGFHDEIVCNWTPWCNFNCMQAFLLVEKDQAKIDEALSRCVRSNDIFIDQFRDDGACDEGPSYFNQAAGMLYSWMQEMYEASGGKFDCFNNPKIRRMGEYESRADMKGGYMANFADAAARLRPSGSLLWSYGKSLGSKELEDFGLYCLRNDKDGFNKPAPGVTGNVGRALQRIKEADELYKDVDALNARCQTEGYEKVLASLRKDVPANSWFPQTQVLFVTTPDWNFAAKGGHNNENHNHNDIGSFILSSREHPALIDVGQTTYVRQTFSAERYTIFAMQSGWHNTPVINGVEQMDGEQYAASNTAFKSKGSTSTFSLNIEGAYPAKAACDSWKRTFIVNGSSKGSVMTITDTYSLSSRNAPDEEHLITAGLVFVPGDSFEGRTVSPGTLFVKDGENVLEIAYSRNLTPSVEVKDLDDRRIAMVWGPQIRRIILKSAPNAPLKGTYKLTVTQK